VLPAENGRLFRRHHAAAEAAADGAQIEGMALH
jgi:hypothetical protein